MEKQIMEKKYNPKEFEEKIYSHWLERDSFKAEVNREKEPFSIVMPPPNITGKLHMGHALDLTIQDILTRYKRLRGFEALWLPGTDHASIATEVKVLEKLKKELGKTKEELTREEFLEHAWEWKHEYGNSINEQMMKLGNSCDWSRERFTMDEGCNDAVTEVFVRLYNEGLIYRGNRLINWCPSCLTTLSDAEVEHEDKAGAFYHVRYEVEGEGDDIIIATTRPETILGDTAIAVHPEDERYAAYIGKFAYLPVLERKIPIVADSYVDMELGTGALKVTPAHDPNDYEIGKRHDLESINIFTEDAKINSNGGKYEGLDRYECRKQIVADLKENGRLVHVKEHDHNVGTCYRCSTVIEPRISDQWFVKMDELAASAIEAVDEKEMEFVPERFTKIYMHWLTNIRDWCISRQLWWGHRIPAYYCNSCGETIVSKSHPDKCSCGSTDIRQDEDVLDTWFSSALWPFSTMGWPQQTEDLDYFYPTSVLVTGYDIIFFWVVRMMFSGKWHTKKSPFRHTLIHGLVRDSEGRKMSKSLGNGVDPLDIIDQYGADALRFMLMSGNSPGSDTRFQIERVEAARNFANKLWNASRFLITNMDEEVGELSGNENLELADKWMISRLDEVIEAVSDNLDKFEIGLAAEKIYQFTWDEYCDWYIEITKSRLYGEDEEAKIAAKKVLLHVLRGILKLLHPFMPFITEEIWQHVPGNETDLVTSEWPVVSEVDYGYEEKSFEKMKEAIRNIRNLRAEMNIHPSRKGRLYLEGDDEIVNMFIENGDYLRSLAYAQDTLKLEGEIEDAAMVILDGIKISMPLSDLIDYEKELERLSKERDLIASEIKRAEGKLSNAGFVAKAPEALVAKEKEKLEKNKEILSDFEARLDEIRNKL